MIKTGIFGTHEGQKIVQATLTSAAGVEIDVFNYGAAIRDWRVPVSEGLRSVVLGFNTFEPYVRHGAYFGAIVGRVANRIGGAKFLLGGQEFPLAANEGNNILHGGVQGLHHQVWNLATNDGDNSVSFTHTSAHLAMGFPGTIKFEILYRLVGSRLEIKLSGIPDCPTPISLAQHNYFNLGQKNTVLAKTVPAKTILDHKLCIAAPHYAPVDADLIPTGDIRPVENSRFDFQEPKTLRNTEGQAWDYDINYVLDAKRSASDPVAQVIGPDAELYLKLYSDRPGVQLYNGAHIATKSIGLTGQKYGAYSGLCLEDQMLPAALNNPHFPSIICTPDNPYHHWCEIEIGQQE